MLRAHAIAAVVWALIVTIFAAIFSNNSLVPPPLTFEQTQIATRGSLLVLSTTAALYWLRFVWRTP